MNQKHLKSNPLDARKQRRAEFFGKSTSEEKEKQGAEEVIRETATEAGEDTKKLEKKKALVPAKDKEVKTLLRNNVETSIKSENQAEQLKEVISRGGKPTPFKNQAMRKLTVMLPEDDYFKLKDAIHQRKKEKPTPTFNVVIHELIDNHLRVE